VRIDLPTDTAVLALAYATLAPNAEIADFEMAGPCLVVVNAGQLDLATPGRATTMGDGSSTWRQFGRLDAGVGGLLVPCTNVDLRNRGTNPVGITMIAFLPAKAVAGDAALARRGARLARGR
jgi:hypothetical protein